MHISSTKPAYSAKGKMACLYINKAVLSSTNFLILDKYLIFYSSFNQVIIRGKSQLI